MQGIKRSTPQSCHVTPRQLLTNAKRGFRESDLSPHSYRTILFKVQIGILAVFLGFVLTASLVD